MLVRALQGLSDSARLDAPPDASSLWAGLFDLRDTLLGRPWTTCERLPPAPVRGGRPSITVVGSVNLDLVARVERLPRAGETVTDAIFARVKGGKGANQAVAAARLGADVTLVCSVGTDLFADEPCRRRRGSTLAARPASTHRPASR